MQQLPDLRAVNTMCKINLLDSPARSIIAQEFQRGTAANDVGLTRIHHVMIFSSGSVACVPNFLSNVSTANSGVLQSSIRSSHGLNCSSPHTYFKNSFQLSPMRMSGFRSMNPFVI